LSGASEHELLSSLLSHLPVSASNLSHEGQFFGDTAPAQGAWDR
jgi:hypothetical protein